MNASSISSAPMLDLQSQVAFRVTKMHYDAAKQQANQMLALIQDATQIGVFQGPGAPGTGQHVNVLA